MEKILAGKDICIMGLGNEFSRNREWLENRYRFRYVTDNNATAASRHPEYSYISPHHLPEIKNLFVIISTSLENFSVLDRQLTSLNVPHCFIDTIIESEKAHPVIHFASISSGAGVVYADHLGNTIELGKNVSLPKNGHVRWGGDETSHWEGNILFARNNRIAIGDETSIPNACSFTFWGQESSVEIGSKNQIFDNANFVFGTKGRFITGSGCSFESFTAVACYGHIKIGDDCMLSHGIELWQTDTHPIFDATTGDRLNSGKNIDVGNHVWCGLHAALLGGCRIGNNSIIGMKSVTSGQFCDGVIIAGSPARIVREGIMWKRDVTLWRKDISHISHCKF